MTPDQLREEGQRALYRGSAKQSKILRTLAEVADAALGIKTHLDNQCQPTWEGPKLRTRLDGALLQLREL